MTILGICRPGLVSSKQGDGDVGHSTARMWPALAVAARAHGIATPTLASVRLSNRRLVSPRFAAASASAARSNSNSSSDQITDDELKGASVAVRLASHVYKVGDIEPWVRREGFTLMAEGETNCTRWYVCDKRAGEATTHRWLIVRGAAWNNEKVDRVRLSTQIGKAWPSPLHEGKGAPPVVVHTGVKEMADEFWPDVSPWITSTPNGARLCFAGHSLGGSMAMLLMAWSKLRLGVDARAMDPCWTFGSPPVLASDGWEMRKRRGADVSESVARAAADGGDWVGELMRGVGVGNDATVEPGADAGEGPGASTPGGSTETGSTRGEAREDALRIAGFDSDSVRAFVLSIDPVPRMWLAADPLFARAAANETVASLMSAREWLFGRGVLSRGRFLYDAAGTLYWMRWAPEAGTAVTVHRGDPDALCEELSRDGAFDWGRTTTTTTTMEGGDDDDGSGGGGTEERSLFDAGLRSVVGAMDHNAQNYVDSIQYLNVRRFTGSSSKAL